MMKRLLALMSVLFMLNGLHAQMYVGSDTLYGNEWINSDQQYYKMYIVEDGVYRIPAQTLAAAGISTSSISTDNFQLFTMGKEVPIYISSASTLNGSDYIEFYAEKNNGKMDAHFFESPDHSFNPFYSMYTDTSAYFLTWNTGTSNARLENESNVLSNLPAPEDYFMHDSYNVQSARFNKGEAYQDILYESRYSPGEGYGSSFVRNGNYQVTTPYAYTGGADAQLTMRFASAQGVPHQVALSLNANNLPLDTATFQGYQMRQVIKDIPTNMLTTTTTVNLQGMQGAEDKHATSFVKISYPRTFDFDNQNTFKFTVAADPGNTKYLEITNFAANGLSPILYDLTNGQRILCFLDNGLVKVALPPSDTDRELLLCHLTNSHTNIDQVFKVSFIDYGLKEGDYIILSHKKFINDPAQDIQAYRDYRALTGFDPIIIDVEEMYDQFGYGINKHAQSIRNLVGYAMLNWSVEPRYMFMVGKSRPDYSIRTNPFNQPSYTPTFGHHSSDNLLTATPESDVPRIPFGRLPVVDPDEVRIYLEKVIAYETERETLPQQVEERARFKRVVHLGGGDAFIQNDIKDNFNKYKNIVEDEYWGAEVTSFFKINDEPTQTSNAATLDSLIENGTTLITFYGHSSVEAFDYNVDDPNEYTNTDRYFTFFSMGCNAGQLHQKVKNLGERFVFAEDKGAIAFIATVSLSTLTALDEFATVFYENIARDHYGEGLGDIIKATIEDIQTLPNIDIGDRIVYQQVTLNGDPAIKIHNTTAPDYIVNKSSIKFEPEEPTNGDDISITFKVSNVGRTSTDSFNIRIDRIFADGSVGTVWEARELTPTSEAEFTYTMPAIPTGAGLNKFKIIVDAEAEITELPNPSAESNNFEIESLFVLNNVVDPVNPSNFGIANDPNNIVLQAAIDPDFANVNLLYAIEIDTTELFNSPLKDSTTITQTGGILEWEPTVAYTDSTVYYWRARVEPGQVDYAGNWEYHSFIILENEFPGWNQSHFYQFKKNTFTNTQYEDNRRFEFIDNFNEIAISTAHYPVLQAHQIDYAVNGSRIYDAESCELNEQGIYLAFLDKDLSVFGNIQINSATNEGLYGSLICKSQAFAFLFPTNSTSGQNKLRDLLNIEMQSFTSVKYVLAYSLNDYEPETWNADLFDAFAARGATQIQNITSLEGVPYACLMSIEDGTAEEAWATSINDVLDHIFTVENKWESGFVESPLIGPALEWGSFHWAITEVEPTDTTGVKIYGVSQNYEETLLATVTDPDYLFDNTIFDATLYPYLRLEYFAKDALQETMPQLEYWRVLYDECLKLDLKVFLEGTYEGNGLMQTKLGSERRVLPGQTPQSPLATPTPPGQPYDAFPWNYAGTEGLGFTNASYPPDVVDWVLVSLRTSVEKEDQIAQAAGLLYKDGRVELMLPCAFETDLPGPFYLVVEHRNHMGIMSATPVELVNNELIYDFTIQDSYKDPTSFGQAEIEPGVWGMYAGDLNQAVDLNSYDINGLDKAPWQADNGLYDIYTSGDANMDGDANGLDKILWEENNGVSSRVPK